MKIYVGNLGKNIKEEDLRKKFEKYGKVLSVTIPVDPNNEPRSFGFVEMEDAKKVLKAIRKMENHSLDEDTFIIHAVQEGERTDENGKDETERDLKEQFFITLRTIYFRTENNSNNNLSQIKSIIKGYFDGGQPSIEENNLVEQLLVQMYDDNHLEVELKRKLVEAKRVLPGPVYRYYSGIHKGIEEAKKKAEEEAKKKAEVNTEEKRTLLSRLINDVQWGNKTRRVKREYSRKIRVRTSWTLIIVIIIFCIFHLVLYPFILKDDTWNEFTCISIAILSGWLGAAFSIIINLNSRLATIENELKLLKVQQGWEFIYSRVIIGVGAALILLFVLKTNTFSMTIFPSLVDNGLSPTNYAMLVVWCILAGFSEKLVPNILSAKEKRLALK